MSRSVLAAKLAVLKSVYKGRRRFVCQQPEEETRLSLTPTISAEHLWSSGNTKVWALAGGPAAALFSIPTLTEAEKRPQFRHLLILSFSSRGKETTHVLPASLCCISCRTRPLMRAPSLPSQSHFLLGRFSKASTP